MRSIAEGIESEVRAHSHGVKGTKFTLLPELTLKLNKIYKSNSFQTLGNRQHRTVNLEGRDTNEVSSTPG